MLQSRALHRSRREASRIPRCSAKHPPPFYVQIPGAACPVSAADVAAPGGGVQSGLLRGDGMCCGGDGG